MASTSMLERRCPSWFSSKISLKTVITVPFLAAFRVCWFNWTVACREGDNCPEQCAQLGELLCFWRENSPPSGLHTTLNGTQINVLQNAVIVSLVLGEHEHHRSVV